ncbi:MAG: hypothetical protein ABIJ45_06510 [Candidatus Zixiibacteriota bacterium]
MSGSNSTLSTISLVVSIVTLIIVGLIFFYIDRNNNKNDYTIEKNLAGELIDNNLYRAAVDKYNAILAQPDLDTEMRANINYLIGKVYFENLFDFEKAASHYIIARSLNPDGSFYHEAGKNLIASLEKMGRMIDAKRELDKSVNIDSVYAANEGETLVAKIGEEPVFLSQVVNEIQKLPKDVQKEFMGVEGKRKFLSQYIGFELMYRAALREGFDRDADILKRKEELAKQLLIEKYAYEKVLPEINIDTTDIRNFYLANKTSKYDDKAYDEVKNQVAMDYQQEKSQQAFTDYIGKLSAVEKVQVFEENIK